jgi:aryl-alcohol dehydrogenase-like predicted oxidoreductase
VDQGFPECIWRRRRGSNPPVAGGTPARALFSRHKNHQRAYDGAKRQIHLSLERLGVDSVDLIQLHSLSASPGTARKFPRFHLRSLERFDFDSVLLPFSYIVRQDPHAR